MYSILSSPDLWTILGTMVLAGIIGGLVNGFLPTAEGEPVKIWWKCILTGLGASLIVPVFLFLTQSKILDELVRVLPENASAQAVSQAISLKVQNYLVFFSFCTIAAITSTRFITTVSDRLLSELKKEVDATKQAVRATDQKVEETQKKAIDNRATLQAVKKKIQEESLVRTTLETTPSAPRPDPRESISRSPAPTPPAVRPATDPQKGRWGGQAVNNFKRLQATITPIDEDEDWFTVRLEVMSTDPDAHPLTGNVVFYLPDTLVPNTRTVVARNNRAFTEETAWSAFTVGAETADGTQLELDLGDPAAVPDVPASFRHR
ncbi:YEATS-associated helix-containing protein [Larkinella insperata]|uniref:YEATS-associated helix-containing protein n=1 Tax=Larkinella insperata TaxID=332158 RepID=A0ABW3QK67_9BACT|nr:YEATS-associated helix-containing protein [Larkinella insperata]